MPDVVHVLHRLTAAFSAAVLTVLLPIVLLGAGCAASQPPADDGITVEGVVTVRGNEPFTVRLLETEDNNLYVLNMSGVEVEDFRTPARYRMTGTLYLGDWNGERFTHLRVQAWECVR